ncbi:hypothetical protein LCGC14_0802510 [marine sediment metagenome]|uniref:Uncharacterized protein n=1 Tax=marine sediment metagenome TaxID=412755 RepID=A0A0F9SWD6_9ZZZZ|nr:hypothetical protein [Candidatus Aminicenantes bacterium]
MKNNNNIKNKAWIKFGYIFRLIKAPYKLKNGTEEHGLFPFIMLNEFMGLDVGWNIVEIPCPKCGKDHRIRFERLASEKNGGFFPIDSMPLNEIKSEKLVKFSEDVEETLRDEKSNHALGRCRNCGGNWFLFNVRKIPFLIKIAPETKEDVMGEKGWP